MSIRPKVNLSNINNSSLTNRTYTGHEDLEDIEFLNMNARMYDSSIARFLSADSIIDGDFKIASIKTIQNDLNFGLIGGEPDLVAISADPKVYLKAGKAITDYRNKNDSKNKHFLDGKKNNLNAIGNAYYNDTKNELKDRLNMVDKTRKIVH